jgi:hypothetical protein
MSISKIECNKPSASGNIRYTLLYLSDEIHDSDINLVAISIVTNCFPHITPAITKTNLRTTLTPIFLLLRHLNNLNLQIHLTLILLMWRIWWAPNNAGKWQIGFISVLKFEVIFITKHKYYAWYFCHHISKSLIIICLRGKAVTS